jgi:RNA polymerase sigma-70 factor (ECF subfamily)
VTIKPTEYRSTGFAPEALVALVPHTRAFARSLCRDPTLGEDLAQDALTMAWRRRDSFHSGTNLKAWLFTIVRNRYISDRRRSWRVVPLDPKLAEERLIFSPNPTAALELDDLRRAMLDLSTEQREALSLVGVACLPHHEVALICGCAVGTVKSRVSRARRKLTTVLASGPLCGERRPPERAAGAILADAGEIMTRATLRATGDAATDRAHHRRSGTG